MIYSPKSDYISCVNNYFVSGHMEWPTYYHAFGNAVHGHFMVVHIHKKMRQVSIIIILLIVSCTNPKTTTEKATGDPAGLSFRLDNWLC